MRALIAPPTRKDYLLVKVERELERIFPNKLEKDKKFLEGRGVVDIIIYRSKKLNTLVKGLTTKQITGLISQMKNTPAWS